jgi:hypothetical protein
MADAEIELVAGAHVHRCGRGHVLCLEGNALVHVEAVGAWLVRLPGIAIEAGVEMDVALDEARHDQRATEIDHLACLGTLSFGEESADAALVDRDGVARASIEPRIDEQLVDGHHADPFSRSATASQPS